MKSNELSRAAIESELKVLLNDVRIRAECGAEIRGESVIVSVVSRADEDDPEHGKLRVLVEPLAVSDDTPEEIVKEVLAAVDEDLQSAEPRLRTHAAWTKAILERRVAASAVQRFRVPAASGRQGGGRGHNRYQRLGYVLQVAGRNVFVGIRARCGQLALRRSQASEKGTRCGPVAHVAAKLASGKSYVSKGERTIEALHKAPVFVKEMQVLMFPFMHRVCGVPGKDQSEYVPPSINRA